MSQPEPTTAARPVTSSPTGHVHYEDDPDTCTEFCDPPATAAKAKHYPVTVNFTWPALILSGVLMLCGAYFVVAWIATAVLYATR